MVLMSLGGIVALLNPGNIEVKGFSGMGPSIIKEQEAEATKREECRGCEPEFMRKKKLYFLVVIILASILIIYFALNKTPNILKKIENGNFFLINNVRTEKQLNDMIYSEFCRVKWVWKDINNDGILELILTEKEKPERIIGIFTVYNDEVSIVLWDDTDTTEYYELCESGLLYYSQYYGRYDKERYILYQYNASWAKEMIKGLEIYCMEGVEAVDERLERLPFMIGEKDDYYFEFRKEEGKEHYKELTREEWLEEFKFLFGKTYQGNML